MAKHLTVLAALLTVLCQPNVSRAEFLTVYGGPASF